jgi:hypothetical protein
MELQLRCAFVRLLAFKAVEELFTATPSLPASILLLTSAHTDFISPEL